MNIGYVSKCRITVSAFHRRIWRAFLRMVSRRGKTDTVLACIAEFASPRNWEVRFWFKVEALARVPLSFLNFPVKLHRRGADEVVFNLQVTREGGAGPQVFDGVWRGQAAKPWLGDMAVDSWRSDTGAVFSTLGQARNAVKPREPRASAPL